MKAQKERETALRAGTADRWWGGGTKCETGFGCAQADRTEAF